MGRTAWQFGSQFGLVKITALGPSRLFAKHQFVCNYYIELGAIAPTARAYADAIGAGRLQAGDRHRNFRRLREDDCRLTLPGLALSGG
jgi:hypothetical protein